MNERSPKVRKSGSPADEQKAERPNPKARKMQEQEEVKPNQANNSEVDIPHSKIKNKSDIEHPTSEISNMEVHHHPEIEKKGLREYIFEGLMIFLAVMMGYFAESAREHLSDGAKEKDYLYALSAELKSDTAMYSSSLHKVFYLRPLLDSLYNNARHPAEYKFILLGKWNTPVNEYGVTYWPALIIIQQLKSSGNLRLIQNQPVAQKIIEYETFVEGDYKEDINDVNKAYNTLYALEDAMCDYTDFNKQVNKNMQMYPDKDVMRSSFMYDMPLFEKDPVKINQLANSVVNINARNWGYMTRLNKAKNEAAALLKLINEKYHFDHE